MLSLIAVLAWRRRRIPGAALLAALALACLIYVIGYAFEMGSATVEAVRLWLKVEYIGLALVPPLTLLLALTYTGLRDRIGPLVSILLFYVPAMILLLAWTNDTHELIWRDLTIDPGGAFTRTFFERGPWYWVQVGYVYLLLLVSAGLLVRAIPRSGRLYRLQQITLLAGLLIPLLLHVIYLTLDIFPGLDVNPYGLTLATAVMAWGILRHGLLDIIPAARQQVVASLTDPVIVLDVRDRVIDLNPAGLRAVALPMEQAVGRPLADLAALGPALIARAAGDSQPGGEIALAVGSELRYYDMEILPLAAAGQPASGRIVVLHDVTARVQSGQRLAALRKMEGELTRKLSRRYVIEIAVDAAQRLSLADTAILALVEGDSLHVHQAAGAPALVDSSQPVDRGIVGRVLRSRQPELTSDVTGDPDYVALTPGIRSQMTVPLIHSGQPIGVLVLETARPARFTQEVFEIINLLAARIAAALSNAILYEERDQLVSELDAFSHTVAHDLKNPLQTILGYAEMSQAVGGQEPRLGHYLAAIRRGAHKSAEIIDSLLLLARTRSADITLEPLDMGRLLEAVQQRLDLQITESGAQLSLPDSWPASQGHGPWVEAIWVNYLSNAIKYGGTPPQIALGWEPLPDQGLVRFWVQDNGEGLTPAQMQNLFQPFSRLNPVREGHGLGLTIVRRIADRLGGAVGAESTPGQGSRFWFTLPAAP